jgi:hypothetical protein
MRQVGAWVAQWLAVVRSLSSRALSSTHRTARALCWLLCAPIRWLGAALLFTGGAFMLACVLVWLVLVGWMEEASGTDRR